MSQIIETLQLPGSTDEYQFRALKLKKTTNGIGSSDTPVYINADGEPVACSSSITSDTKVQQSKSTTNNTFPLLASSSTNPNGLSTTTIYNEYGPKINPALYSLSEGYSTTASGSYSHSEGNTTVASGPASHAEGSESKSLGASAHAEGSLTNALGDNTHAEGRGSTVSLGNVTVKVSDTQYTLSGITVTIEGSTYTLKVGDIVNYNSNYAKVTAISGNTITINQTLSAAVGNAISLVKGVSYGARAHTEGYLTAATENQAHAEGYLSIASGGCAHAEGLSTRATGWGAHAEGKETTSSNYYSHAEGLSTTASEYASHAEGYSTKASGSYSHAEGCGTTASGNYSHAGGYHTIADQMYETVVGMYNTANTENTLFAVGDGTRVEDEYRSDAFRVNSLGSKTGANSVPSSVQAKVNGVSDVYLGCPIGTVVMWAGTTAPDGWLLCDGSNIYPSDADYNLLVHIVSSNKHGKIYEPLCQIINYNKFTIVRNKIVGPEWGGKFIKNGTLDTTTNVFTITSWDSEVSVAYKFDTVPTGYRYYQTEIPSSNTVEYDIFPLPNFSKKFPLGAQTCGTIGKNGNTSTSTGWSTNLGSTGGEDKHTLGATEIEHQHNSTETDANTGISVLKQTSPSVTSVNNIQPHNNIPPFLAINFIIKYK